MKQTVGFNDFCDAFVRMDRNNSFSYKGKQALFDWLEEYEQECGQEIELDVIALCCEWDEHASAFDALRDLGYSAEVAKIESENPDDDEAREEAARKYFDERTTVVDIAGGGILLSEF